MNGRRSMAAASGLMLIVAGVVAAITGEFEGEASWLFALGLALVGVVGLGTALVRRPDSVGETAAG